MKYRQKGGWYGDSQGHSLAARGVRLYAHKERLMDPVFAARKREEDISFSHMSQMLKEGYNFHQIRQMHPNVDQETVRQQGIKAMDARTGSNTMTMLNSNGVDTTVRMARVNKNVKERAISALHDSQKASFLPEVKVQLLKNRLGDIDNER